MARARKDSSRQYPVHDILPELRGVLAPAGGAAVLEAPPGAGKSTVVPLELLRSDDIITPGRRILMLEPRRLAARAVAGRMADLLGEPVGETVGYRVRFESRVSKATRIEVVTEGILTRRIQSDPELADVSLVIFDEFHERNLYGDLALALCLEAREALREDLRVLVMSATLEDTAPAVAKLLAQSNPGKAAAPVLTSAGRMHPVDVRHLREFALPDAQLYPAAIAERVVAAIYFALNDAEGTGGRGSDTGDLLVFLPGAGEIRRVEASLLDSRDPAVAACALLPLYGELSRDAQTAALAPDPRGRRKIILATPIAETSLTIEGVSVVVDSGLRRAPRYEPATGLSRLQLMRISRASAAQRAGRAGRLGPGRAYRLWSEHDHDRLEARSRPEILEADLAPLVLELAAWGVPVAADRPVPLPFLDPPPRAHLERAAGLLQELGALVEPAGEGGATASLKISPAGREMVRLPVHPRLARMAIQAARSTAWLSSKLQSDENYRTALAADLAAILSERDPLRGAGPGGGPLSIAPRLAGLYNFRRGASRSAGAQSYSDGDPNAYRTIDQTARQLRRMLAFGADHSIEADSEKASDRSAKPRSHATPDRPPADSDLGALLAIAYPDRIALAREGSAGRYLLASGTGAVLSARNAAGESAGNETPAALVVLDLAPGHPGNASSAASDGRGENQIRMMAPLAQAAGEAVERINAIFADRLRGETVIAWDVKAERVRAREELRFGALALASRNLEAGFDAGDAANDSAIQIRDAFLEGLRQIMKRGGTASLAANEADREGFAGLQARIQFLRARGHEHDFGTIPGLPGGQALPDLSEAALAAHPEDWLADFIAGHQSFASFRKSFRLIDAIQSLLPYATRAWLDEAAPTHLTVPSGSRIRLEYNEAEVVLAVKLQELFGLRETPRVAMGRESVTLHLLSPARRPIQVTRDLAGFWERTYGEVKKELKGRYPKHPWPDDPFDPVEAVATRHAKKRRT